jgi:hypothetical protein
MYVCKSTISKIIHALLKKNYQQGKSVTLFNEILLIL